MSVVPSSDLDFGELPGRASADPFAGLETGDLSVRVVIIADTPGRNLHRHPFSPEVVFVAEGHGVAWQNGTATRVGPGDIVWIPTDAPHATVPDRGSQLKLVCFFPHGDLRANLVELDETVSIMNLQGTKANLIYDLDFTHWDESHRADEYSSLRSQAYGETERPAVELPPTDMFREQLEEFALAIRGHGRVEVGAAEAIRALAVVRAALESSERAGAAVGLGDVIEAAGAAGVAT